jgi:flavodoxin
VRTLIAVESQFGNTARIAEAIARGLAPAGEVCVVAAGSPDLLALVGGRPDLMLIGGPTVNRGMTRELGAVVEQVAPALAGLRVAAFDTRMRGSELIMGSAAKRLVRRVLATGAVEAAPRECFFVRRAEPPAGERRGPQHVALDDGEETRAEAWGTELARMMASVVAG